MCLSFTWTERVRGIRRQDFNLAEQHHAGLVRNQPFVSGQLGFGGVFHRDKKFHAPSLREFRDSSVKELCHSSGRGQRDWNDAG